MAACSRPERPPRITNDSQMSFELRDVPLDERRLVG
jgi:hypothetical protein